MATVSACSQYVMRVAVRVLAATASGSERPVTRPSFAERNCTRPAMRLAMTITQTSRKPYCAPALTLAATLPGSTYAIAATNAGPNSASPDRGRACVTVITPPIFHPDERIEKLGYPKQQRL